MNIQLISHASVVLSTEDCSIWTDPWLDGRAFNESWALYPPAVFDSDLFERIDYIWISHEHPDHFHIPTLRNLPLAFKEKTPVLFQRNNSQKVFDALSKFGFKHFIELPHRKIIQLKGATSIYCYHVGNMDSALGVLSNAESVLNANDCEINTKDCEIIKSDIGEVDVILNQYSIAGYSGQEDRGERLPIIAKSIMNNFVENHRDLDAAFSIPMASLVYFCQQDNRYINDYTNTIIDVYERMNKEGLGCTVLYPGERWDTKGLHDNRSSVERYREAYDRFDELAIIYSSESVELNKIREAYVDRFDQINAAYWKLFRLFLGTITVKVPDLKCNVVFSMRSKVFLVLPESDDCDLIISSQPFWFLFAMPFGCQTLGVSSRHIWRKNFKNWKLYRILFSLNNAEIYLSMSFFKRANLSWIAGRMKGMLNQVFYQFKRM